jgi:hypothetical protein
MEDPLKYIRTSTDVDVNNINTKSDFSAKHHATIRNISVVKAKKQRLAFCEFIRETIYKRINELS